MPTSRAESPCRPASCTAGVADMTCRPASSTCRRSFPLTMRKLSCPSEGRADYWALCGRKRPPRGRPLFAKSYVLLLLAGIHPAVVEFCHGTGLADEAVARRVVLCGVAVGCVGATRVVPRASIVGITIVTRSAIVRRGGCDSSSRTDCGGTYYASPDHTGAIRSSPILPPRNTRTAQGSQRATNPCLGTLDRQ